MSVVGVIPCYVSNRPHFLWVLCWENTRKVCKSRAEGDCFYKITMSLPAQ